MEVAFKSILGNSRKEEMAEAAKHWRAEQMFNKTTNLKTLPEIKWSVLDQTFIY